MQNNTKSTPSRAWALQSVEGSNAQISVCCRWLMWIVQVTKCPILCELLLWMGTSARFFVVEFSSSMPGCHRSMITGQAHKNGEIELRSSRTKALKSEILFTWCCCMAQKVQKLVIIGVVDCCKMRSETSSLMLNSVQLSVVTGIPAYFGCKALLDTW